MCPPYPGSPPLARGTDEFADQRRKHTRITPACAGNRQSARWCTLRRKDHPRLRGEQCLNNSMTMAMVGSPPLARGTERGRAIKSCRKGITPACAGNRFFYLCSLCGGWDHPRLRGEQLSLRDKTIWSRGSPPLARGTVVLQF